MTSIDDLRKTAWAARDALAAAEAAENDKRNNAIVGRFFTMQNNYSMPEGPQDYWPLYVKVLRAAGGGVTTFEFQRDKYGKCEVETSVERSGIVLSQYREISEEDFKREWATFLATMVSEATAAIEA